MSYDVYFRCPTCGVQSYELDGADGPTYNLSEIFHLALTGEPFPSPNVTEGQAVILRTPVAALRGLRVLDGKTGAESLPLLRRAHAALNDPAREAEFRALEPDNKWGDLESARKCIYAYLEAAHEHPEWKWRIS